jgi:hypothetical protein
LKFSNTRVAVLMSVRSKERTCHEAPSRYTVMLWLSYVHTTRTGLAWMYCFSSGFFVCSPTRTSPVLSTDKNRFRISVEFLVQSYLCEVLQGLVLYCVCTYKDWSCFSCRPACAQSYKDSSYRSCRNVEFSSSPFCVRSNKDRACPMYTHTRAGFAWLFSPTTSPVHMKSYKDWSLYSPMTMGPMLA